MVRSARNGDPFTEVNARRLRWLAVLIPAGGTSVSVLGAWLRRWLLDTSGAGRIVTHDWPISLSPLLAGALVAVLAQVWRRGVAMRRDLEGLV